MLKALSRTSWLDNGVGAGGSRFAKQNHGRLDGRLGIDNINNQCCEGRGHVQSARSVRRAPEAGTNVSAGAELPNHLGTWSQGLGGGSLHEHVRSDFKMRW